MAQDNYMLQIKEIVKTLPNGWKGQVTGDSNSKRVLFNRMMNKESVAQMSATELELLNKLLEVIKDFKQNNERIEREIKKVIEK